MQAKRERLPAPEEWIKDLFIYKDGELYWSSHEANKRKHFKDRPIGEGSNQKYVSVRFNKQMHQLHRLIYWLHTGDWPAYVAHKDGNTKNNKIENLIPISAEELNVTKYGNGNIDERLNKDGSRSYYVTYNSRKGAFYIGTYKTKIDALYASYLFKELLYPGFAVFPKCTPEELQAVKDKFQCEVRLHHELQCTE